MNRYTLTGLSVTGGFLTGLAWTDWCPGLILLVSFIPFFIIEDQIHKNPRGFTPNAFFIYLLPGFVVFSITTLGWMRVASMTGAITVIMGLSFLMAFTMWMAHLVHVKTGRLPGYISFFAFWLSYELITLNISIISPWINLGNGLSKDIMFIQWYDLTGTSGGTLWILLSNFFLARFILSTERRLILIAVWLCLILIPSVFSIFRFHSVKPNESAPGEVVIIQPNIDPYTEKFIIPFEDQLQLAVLMADSAATKNTDWIVTPETTVDDPVNLEDPENNIYVGMLKKLTLKNPQSCIVTGLVSYRLYPPSSKAPTMSARKTDDEGLYYDHFNSAFAIDSGKDIQVYHKSKLVPGIEMQFGPGRLISKMLPDLGGTSWGYGIQKERTCLRHPSAGYMIAPVICYESIFGSYVTGYVKNGAEALFIITNDGWWKNTNGYKQHLYYASLRAIETRRPVIRSANTGVSCIIDIRGKRKTETTWWTRQLIRDTFNPENRITVYVKYGDYLMRIASVISAVIIILVFIGVPLRKKNKYFP